MKKFIAIIALVSVLSCAGCGEKAESSTVSTSSSSAVENSAAEESVAEESSEEESSAAESSENDEDYFDWWGIKMYRPANYYVMNTEGFPHASINDDDGILTNIVYYTLNDDSVEQTPEAVKDYIYSSAMRSSILASEHCRRPKWKNGNYMIAKQPYFGIIQIIKAMFSVIVCTESIAPFFLSDDIQFSSYARLTIILPCFSAYRIVL